MKNVVVTGLGMVTPIGLSVAETWSAAIEGKSGIGPITRFDATGYPATIAGELKGFDPLDYFDGKEAKKMDAFIHYAVAAAKEAIADAGIDYKSLAADQQKRFGVVIGSGIGGMPIIERTAIKLKERGPRKVSPFFIPSVLANLASGQVSIYFGLKGPHACPVTACTTGASAIGDAARIIERGDADIIVAGGAEGAITGLALAGFASAKALSKRNDDPEKASRPFDVNRDGFVIGEGAGVVIVESRKSAEERGAKIYAEVKGYGMSGDAFHITSPPPEGDGAVACMKNALEDAGVEPAEIDYINAHATSTMADTIETRGIKKVFGQSANDVAISSTKSMTGHLLGAAGGIEAIFSIKTIETGVIPPTINLTDPDPTCDLDYTPLVAGKKEVKNALSNSFGFGGVNGALVFGKAEA